MTSDEAPLPGDAQARRLLVGPESVCWRFASDARLYLVMRYPLLLQVAHPTVAAGLRDFSDFDRRPWQRLLRTLDYVGLLVYGGEEAIAAGRRLRALHKSFTGADPPDDWSDFLAYFHRVSRTVLVPNEQVRRVLQAVELSGPPAVPLPGPIWSLARLPARRALGDGAERTRRLADRVATPS
jgi:uncharacterized protein (DUF2236 family)